MRTLELLAPAKNLECGMAAVDHGADAVYIGAPSHGARVSACNSIEDIQQLCQYAHLFGVRVFVTVNTIVYDAELRDTMTMMDSLLAVGVDAFLIQDMGLVQALGGKYPLHASTQCDTRTADKVRWLRSLGFRRVVLARELSLADIQAIHEAVPDVELEVFVHGALCVSYSGVCYASQYCMRRSANRGECAQFCRLAFDLEDADGKRIAEQRYLLSLKDMCRIDFLEQLADAGACSFKIEGRLKDVDYVKNVVAAYSMQLNELVASRPQDFRRASRGKVEYNFSPDLQKTFNRGFTSYFLEGRRDPIANPYTPKAVGIYVGKVKEVKGNSLTVAGTASFTNGDGLTFFDANHRLQGFRVNRVEGNRLFPQRMPNGLRPGMSLCRNHDEAFSRQMTGKTAVRRLPVAWVLDKTDTGFSLSSQDISVSVDFPHQPAQQPQTKNINEQLSRLGNTPFVLDRLTVHSDADQCFIPNKVLGELRRTLVERLMSALQEGRSSECDAQHPEQEGVAASPRHWQPSYAAYPYLYNIANAQAASFYESRGMKSPAKAFELTPHMEKPLLMQCRHCIRFAMGYCVKHGGKRPEWREPLYLRLPDGKRFRLEFRCDLCQMNVYGA